MQWKKLHIIICLSVYLSIFFSTDLLHQTTIHTDILCMYAIFLVDWIGESIDITIICYLRVDRNTNGMTTTLASSFSFFAADIFVLLLCWCFMESEKGLYVMPCLCSLLGCTTKEKSYYGNDMAHTHTNE